MRRKFYGGMVVAVALLVAGATAFRAQEPPAPPEPLEPPSADQYFVLTGDGEAHLGVTLGDVTTERAQELKLPAVAGALVKTVQKGSAAAKAGLEAGDAIMEFDGVRVRSAAELRRLIRETPAGRTVEMQVVRGGATRVLSAKLEAGSNPFNLSAPRFDMPAINVAPDIHIPPMNLNIFGDHRATLGITAEELTPQLAQYFGVKQGKGVLISEVTTGGAADKAGLKAGDVIVQVDGKPVSGIEELRNALDENFEDDTRKVSLMIVRDHHEQTVHAELTRSSAWGKHTSALTGHGYADALARSLAQADAQRALASQLRALTQSESAALRTQLLQQAQKERAEWKRQLEEQMRSLRDQLNQARILRANLPQSGEI